MEQAALQTMVRDIEATGARLVSITPEVITTTRTLPPGHPFDTVFDQAGLTTRSFPVLIDKGNQVARQFGLVHHIPDALKALHQQFGIDLEQHNGDDSWTLPLPAVFIIDQNGMIRHTEIQVDYRRRAEPIETLATLIANRQASG